MLRSLIHWFSRFLLFLLGWRVQISGPLPRRCIVLGAPHTSNWDLVFALLLMGVTRTRFHWIGKKEIFRWPVAGLFTALGGIPVNRRVRQDFVGQIVSMFNQADTLRIAIAPEGTRSLAPYWRTGFYYMALNADVPIVMAFVDGGRKIVGWGKSFVPSGNLYQDFEILQQFYADHKGIIPRNQGPVIPAPPKEPVPAVPAEP